jgi:hypothetical protein
MSTYPMIYYSRPSTVQVRFYKLFPRVGVAPSFTCLRIQIHAYIRLDIQDSISLQMYLLGWEETEDKTRFCGQGLLPSGSLERHT